MRRSEGETPVGDDTYYGHGTPVRGGSPDVAYDELEPVGDDTDYGQGTPVRGGAPDAYDELEPVGGTAPDDAYDHWTDRGFPDLSYKPEPGSPAVATRPRIDTPYGGGYPGISSTSTVTTRQSTDPLHPEKSPYPTLESNSTLSTPTTTGSEPPDSSFHPWRCVGMTLFFLVLAIVSVWVHRFVKEQIDVFCTDLNGQMSRLGLTRVRALSDTGSVDDTVQIESEDGDVIGMATCRLSGEFAAWYIEMQRRDVLTPEPSTCPPFALSKAAVSITGPR
eukprot:906160_1